VITPIAGPRRSRLGRRYVVIDTALRDAPAER
jgi:hypothetical protein